MTLGLPSIDSVLRVLHAPLVAVAERFDEAEEVWEPFLHDDDDVVHLSA